LEVIVIIDGPDHGTFRALEELKDARMTVLMLDENVGGAEARNTGVQIARGEWVAFLDDDDFWVPEKLEKQISLAMMLRAPYPVISATVLVPGQDVDRTLPRRLFKTGEDVGEYLFRRHGFAYGDGMLQTSTLLTKRELLLKIPFTAGLKRHQDWDWLLRVTQYPGVAVAMHPDALTVMRMEGVGESLSRSSDWEFSLAWVRQNRHCISRKAYAYFLTTECLPRARKSGAGGLVILRLLWECAWRGQPGVRQIMLFLGFWAFSEKTRKAMRNYVLRTAAEGRG